MIIKEIYRKYFQKSSTFLYPLLGFKKGKHPKPVQTYVYWPGFPEHASENKLFCVYKRKDTVEWAQFERDYLITHKMLHTTVALEDDQIMYVFDMTPVAEDFKAFMNGKYSQFSQSSRKILMDYYGVHTPEWVYIESYLFPDKYFKQYAQILDVEESFLKHVGELCDRYDTARETCTLPVPQDFTVV